MKRIVLGALIVLTVCRSYAQNKTPEDLINDRTKPIAKDPNDTIPKIWKVGGLFTLNFNQTALSNWSAGGDPSTLSINTFFHGYAFYKKDRNSWDNTLDLAYGDVITTSQGSRKSNDRIDMTSKYGYEFAKSWYASLLFNAHTQFAPGYTFLGDTAKILTSSTLSPAYLGLSPGVNYMPNDQFSVFFSPASARLVIVTNDSLASVGAFGVDSGKHTTFQFGALASITYSHKFSDNAAYTGRLDLYSNYLKNPQYVYLNWYNMLVVKVAKLVSMSLAVNLIYDHDTQSINSQGVEGPPKLQLQEMFGIGLAIKL
jgi:Protein of unknown function (DUF3078)